MPRKLFIVVRSRGRKPVLKLCNNQRPKTSVQDPSCWLASWSFYHISSILVHDDSSTASFGGNSISNRAKVENLEQLSVSCISRVTLITYLDICQVVPLHSCDTAAVVELDLPDAAQVRQQVLDTFSGLDVPHLQGAIGA